MVEKCCFCCSLRCGTIFYGVYTLLAGAVNIVYLALAMLGIKTADDILHGNEDDSQNLGDESTEKVLDIFEILVWVQIALTGLWVLCAIIMLAGVCGKVRCCLLPWAIITFFFTLALVYGIYKVIREIVDLSKTDDPMMPSILKLGTYGLGVLFNAYGLLIVISYWKRNMEEMDHQPVPQCA